MSFLIKEDYETSINENILDAITTFNDLKLQQAEAAAQAEMLSYLAARYDTTAVFAATGVNRNPVIVMYLKDITLYHLHALINPRKIPEHRKERYDHAKEWLTMVMELKLNPELPLPAVAGDKQYIKFGGNPKRENHI